MKVWPIETARWPRTTLCAGNSPDILSMRAWRRVVWSLVAVGQNESAHARRRTWGGLFNVNPNRSTQNELPGPRAHIGAEPDRLAEISGANAVFGRPFSVQARLLPISAVAVGPPFSCQNPTTFERGGNSLLPSTHFELALLCPAAPPGPKRSSKTRRQPASIDFQNSLRQSIPFVPDRRLPAWKSDGRKRTNRSPRNATICAHYNYQGTTPVGDAGAGRQFAARQDFSAQLYRLNVLRQ